MSLVNAFKRLVSGKKPLASDVNQLIDAFSGNADVGPLSLFAPIAAPSAPTVAINTTAGVLNGNYQYILVDVTGWIGSDNQLYVQGFAPSAASAVVAPANQQVNTTFTVGPAGTIARILYRTLAGGSTYKFVQWFGDNTTTTWTDNIADVNLGTGMPTVNGTAIPATVPISNSTGTTLPGDTIRGVNALSHGPALNALMHFENMLTTTRGVQGIFTRGSAANNPSTLVSLGNNVPAFVPGKFGNSLSIWEGTTNLVYNSDFETVTGTATVFSDPLTSYTGSTAPAPWTTQQGSFTFGASGATSGATGSRMYAGNAQWKPLTGSNGTALSMTVQATFTTPATLSTADSNGMLKCYIDANNDYEAYITNNTFYLVKRVNNSWSSLANIAITPSASHTYTISLSLTPSGGLTAKLYDGVNTAGTLLQTLTATDTSLTGGFLIGVGGDTGVVVKSAQVLAPFADGWTIGGDSRVAWALTKVNPISGSTSINVVGVSGLSGWIQTGISVSVSAGQTYTISVYANANNLVNNAYAWVNYNTGDSQTDAMLPSGTFSTQRVSQSHTISSATSIVSYGLQVHDAGTVVFDAIQLEQKVYATPYLRNDSTSGSATRATETLTIPGSLWNASAGTMRVLVNVGRSILNSGANLAIFGFGASASNNLTLFIDNTNGKLTSFFGDGAQQQTLVGQTVLVANTWYDVVLRWQPSGVDIFVNGVKDASSSVKPVPTPPTNVHLFTNASGGDNLDGIADEFAVFNRALTDAEIYGLYYATQPLIDAFENPMVSDVQSFNQYASSPDSSDIYTIVQYKRRDGTLKIKSTLSNPDANGNYQTDTVQHYDDSGTVVLWTDTWSVTYDSYGHITSKVVS